MIVCALVRLEQGPLESTFRPVERGGIRSSTGQDH